MKFIINVKMFMIGLLYENKEPSLTRVMTVIAFLAFLVGSAFLLVKGQHWDHYDTFAAATAGGGVGGQLVNKFMNLSKGSPENVPFIKNNQNGGS
jgi:hypothetical protein